MKSFIRTLIFSSILFLAAACAAPPAPTAQQPTAAIPQLLPTSSPLPTQPLETPPPAEAEPAPESPPPGEVEAAPQPTPSTAPEVQPTTPEEPAAPDACTNKAAFFDDVTIPDGTSFKQNVPFVKTWRVRNEGTCAWDADYVLIFHSGDPMNGPLSSPLPAAAPGAVVDLSVDLKSPSSSGAYTGYWELQSSSGSRFGTGSSGKGLLWVKIGVSIFDENGERVAAVGAPAPAPAAAAGDCAPQEDRSFEQDLLTLINAARAENGLSALALNEKLSAAAFSHSADMACGDYVDHVGSDGSTWYTRIKAQGYAYSYASENIYVGNPAFSGTPQGTFDWWMNSPIHRDNILTTRATEIGIGYANLPGSTYIGYSTLNFARP